MATHKVVINTCFGGFSLSYRAVQLLNERKGREAASPNYGTLRDVARHDPDLVAVVEALGSEAASGDCAELEIVEIEGNVYRIDEYDGTEGVVTPETESWITIE